MKYTIEYLENGAREWQTMEPFEDWMPYANVVDLYLRITDKKEKEWEAARLVAAGADGTEYKLNDWEPPSVQ